jgi:hypothetical protein
VGTERVYSEDLKRTDQFSVSARLEDNIKKGLLTRCGDDDG